MSDIGTPSGIDRRTLLKGAAVAGVAAWTAPMIIDSVTSPAAAASGATIPCSWFYVAFKKPGDSVVYWTGSNSNACNTLSTNNAGTTCKTCGGTTYSLFNGQGVMKYGSQCGSGTSATAAGASCSQFIAINGATVQAIGGATILAAFSHPSSSLSCACPNNTNSGNSITVCGSSAGGCNCDAQSN